MHLGTRAAPPLLPDGARQLTAMLPGRYRFDNFAVGPANRAAASAARAVAQSPGTVHNPLYLHGKAGLGKTHLLAAIGDAVGKAWTDALIEYCPAPDFAAQLHAAATAGRLEAFRRRFAAVDLMLLDDVHLLPGEPAVDAEVLRLIVSLLGSGGQFVAAGRQAPQTIVGLDGPLRERLASGRVVALEPLDYETRLSILRHLGGRGEGVAPDALESLAHAPVPGVPELRDALSVLREPTRRPAPGLLANEPPPPHAPVAMPDEYQAFLDEIANAVSRSVEQWRLRLGEAIARWSGEGFRTAVLERHLEDAEVPDLETLEADFVAAVNRLRSLEAEATRLDARLSGLAVFRDPERLSEAEVVVLRALATHDAPPGPLSHLRLENFVAGRGNRLALRAVADVVAIPAGKHNPLFLHGPAGAGKTHLLHGVGNALLAREGPALSVACVDAVDFASELSTALHEGTLERWRMRYRAMDAVLIDDLQDLQGNRDAGAELLLLLRASRDGSRQMALAADRRPEDLAFAPELAALLGKGLVMELGRVTEAERVALHTPVPAGAEAAAPTIDAVYQERAETPADSRAAAFRAILGELDPFFLDPEKIVMDWPGIDGRVVEEMR